LHRYRELLDECAQRGQIRYAILVTRLMGGAG
jgi:hypothetical protein